MELQHLLKLITGTVLNPNSLTKKLLSQTVSQVTIDSRRVNHSTIFIACKGALPTSTDGHDFIKVAQKQKALCIIIEDKNGVDTNSDIPTFLVKNSRITAAKLSESFYKDSSKDMQVCGVTGTNGKTTVSFLTAAIMKSFGKKSAVIGTLGMGEPDNLNYFGMTTPEAETISHFLFDLKQAHYEHVTLEVSSHALATYRVDGIHFFAAAFTNLSVDHLDFHGDMKTYENAKNRLFLELLQKTTYAIVPQNHSIIPQLQNKNHPIMTWGHSQTADVFASDIENHKQGLNFNLNIKNKQEKVNSNFFGVYNVDNMLCAAGLATASGVDIQTIAKSLSNIMPPPGRMEQVSTGNKSEPTVLIDFAHTPDALLKVLTTLKSCLKGKLTVVFGCGGNRDKTKRPQMGHIAAKLADKVFITNDNPKHEDPDTIIQEIFAGVDEKHKNKCSQIADREKAITEALNKSQPEDIVLIAGKGAETTMQIGNIKLPFNDAEIAKAILEDMQS